MGIEVRNDDKVVSEKVDVRVDGESRVDEKLVPYVPDEKVLRPYREFFERELEVIRTMGQNNRS